MSDLARLVAQAREFISDSIAWTNISDTGEQAGCEWCGGVWKPNPGQVAGYIDHEMSCEVAIWLREADEALKDNQTP